MEQDVSLPKKEGGLCFRDLHEFNRRLLANQAWRILENLQSLLARLYKGMYHPTNSFLQAETGIISSYGWISIQQGKELLRQGLRLRIENSQTTRIWEDPWLPTIPPRSTSGPVLDSTMTISDLWKEGKREWDPIIFEEVLNPN